ncbi:MAG: DUF4097 family beta strand repeat protein [Candidatus Aminicenantes bacterium]|nr:DUF4097 family beta strand repeat protein [Candidatus Aminicenantes bacterium]
MRKFILIFSLLVIIVLINACIIAIVEHPESSKPPRLDEFHRILPMQSGTTLSIDNPRGNVEIQGWEQEEAEILAEIFLPLPHKTNFRLAWNLKPAEVDVDQFEDLIKITTIMKEDKESNYVDYFIKVPESVKLKDIFVESGNVFIYDLYGEVVTEILSGDLEVDNFSGSLIANVVNGSVQATIYDLRMEDKIMITTKEGDIAIYLEENVIMRVEAEALNGEVFSDFDLEEIKPQGKVTSQIGKGEGGILSLSATNGDIWIKKINQ